MIWETMVMDGVIQSPSETAPAARAVHIAAAHGERLVSSSTYHPWLMEPEFTRLMTHIQGHTMVDIARCHELWSLVGETAKIDGDILEVGVWRGGTGCLMAAHAQMIDRGCVTFLCDTFQGVVKAGVNDPAYSGGEHADTDITTVNRLLVDAKVHNCIVLRGIFPDETGPLIESRRFRLCHIDVDVYQSALDVFEWVWPRMSVGGAVVFDDYGFSSCAGITMLAEELRSRQDLVFIHNTNGHGILIKTKD